MRLGHPQPQRDQDRRAFQLTPGDNITDRHPPLLRRVHGPNSGRRQPPDALSQRPEQLLLQGQVIRTQLRRRGASLRVNGWFKIFWSSAIGYSVRRSPRRPTWPEPRAPTCHEIRQRNNARTDPRSAARSRHRPARPRFEGCPDRRSRRLHHRGSLSRCGRLLEGNRHSLFCCKGRGRCCNDPPTRGSSCLRPRAQARAGQTVGDEGSNAAGSTNWHSLRPARSIVWLHKYRPGPTTARGFSASAVSCHADVRGPVSSLRPLCSGQLVER